MWTRFIFALRGALPWINRTLASWKLSVVLMLLAALYYALLAIWSTTSPSHVVQSIAGLVPYWAVYILLLLNTGFCLYQRIPALIRQPRAMLGSFVFHLAFFVVAIGFMTTLVARRESKVWVAEGEDFIGSDEQYLAAPVAGRELRFKVEKITPEFWRDQLLFTQLAAELRMADGSVATTRINRPLWLGPATFLRLSGFGYAPRWELLDERGRSIDSAFSKLNVFPPGQRDQIRIPDYPHRIQVEVYPDHVLEDGAVLNRSNNLVNPGVVVEVSRGKLRLGEALLAPGKGYSFEGLTLHFPEIRYWGEFTVLVDPGAPVIFVGFALGLIGLVIRLLRPRGTP